MPGATAATNTNVFYVSKQGRDTWSGKLAAPNAKRTDGPFASLTKARDAVRALHPNRALSTPAVVYVRGGTYALSQPVTFTSQDSGTSSAKITYAAYPGEQPIVSGGRQITGWTPYAGSNLPASAIGHVWVASVPGVTEGWNFHQLFVGGQRRTRARTPNRGSYARIDGMATAWPAQAQFKFHPGDISDRWAAGNVELVTLQSWAETRDVISKVDSASQLVTLNGWYGPAGLEANARYFVENTLDAVDSPGEWYLDRQTGVVYYYPLPDEDVSKMSVVAPYLSQLVLFQGNAATSQWVANITISGLTFSYADWSLPDTGHAAQAAYDVPAAVSGTGTVSVSIQKCLFTHLGGYAVELGKGSRSGAIVGNDMNDLGAGGVKIGDPMIPSTSAMTSGSMQLTDNTISEIGQVYPSAVGVWVGQSADNTVAHNEIYDTYYSAISVGWTWGTGPSGAARNTIEYNDIHDVGRGLLSDMGCIYTLGVQPGTVERYNLCHDVYRFLYGGFGIYLDQGSSQILAENNVVYDTQDGGLVVSTDQSGDVVRNNILALGQTTQIWRAAPTPGPSLTFTRNIVYWEQGQFLNGFWDDYSNYSFDYNLYYCPGDLPTFPFPSFTSFLGGWYSWGQDFHSLYADPLFTNPSQGDFTLRSGSPASKIGFQTIDLSTVGPRPAMQR